MSKKKIADYIENLRKLLKIEKDEDFRMYREKVQNTSISERVKEGVCWYPVHTDGAAYDFGEQLICEFSRITNENAAHAFSSGSLVSVFSNFAGNSESDVFVNAVVNRVKNNKMTVTLHTREFPAWLKSGKIGIQLLFDENTYLEMEYALSKLLKNEDETIERLKDVLIGDSVPMFETNESVEIPVLNESQNIALNKVRHAQEVALVHGPPGTGKTTTLVQSIKHILKSEKQVLVCAPSNAAVDLLAEKLSAEAVSVVRIGHPARVTEENLDLTLDAKISKHENYALLKSLKKQAEQAAKTAGKFKRNFGEAERTERRELYAEAKQLREEAAQLEFFISQSILSEARVIAATLVGCNNMSLKGRTYRTVFLDEASQALEPAAWIPILKSERIIFAGDHLQLPPTVKSQLAAKQGLAETLFEKCMKKHSSASALLETQYRMNEQIMNFSNRYFYNEKLVAHVSVATHKLFDSDMPLEFIDTAGCGFSEQTNPETLSTHNREEAELLFSHFEKYLAELEYSGKIKSLKNIGIISPYSAQVSVLKDIMQNKQFADYVVSRTAVNTVDSFQGQERDVIYISLVRSNSEGNIGFLSDIRRMNVAMTRARKKLVVIGDSATITRHPFYSKFLDYVNEIGAYRSAYEFLY